LLADQLLRERSHPIGVTAAARITKEGRFALQSLYCGPVLVAADRAPGG